MTWWTFLQALVLQPMRIRLAVVSAALVGSSGALGLVAARGPQAGGPLLLIYLVALNFVFLGAFSTLVFSFSPVEEIATSARSYVGALGFRWRHLLLGLFGPVLLGTVVLACIGGLIAGIPPALADPALSWSQFILPFMRLAWVAAIVVIGGFGLRLRLGPSSPIRNGGYLIGVGLSLFVIVSKSCPETSAVILQWFAGEAFRFTDAATFVLLPWAGFALVWWGARGARLLLR